MHTPLSTVFGTNIYNSPPRQIVLLQIVGPQKKKPEFVRNFTYEALLTSNREASNAPIELYFWPCRLSFHLVNNERHGHDIPLTRTTPAAATALNPLWCSFLPNAELWIYSSSPSFSTPSTHQRRGACECFVYITVPSTAIVVVVVVQKRD